MTIRAPRPDEIARVAELHRTRITEGFLPRLGGHFLRRLYRRITRSPHAFLLVAVEEGDVVGYVAVATDLRALYRSFLLRDGVVAAIGAAPRLARALPRALETLRYPAGVAALPAAEILAVAVAADAGGRGVGGALVEAGLTELRRRGVPEAKVVAGSDNGAALRMYERSGFARRARLAVHGGTDSEVLVWTSSSR